LIRGPSLAATMSQYLIDQILNTPNAQVQPHSTIVDMKGADELEAITIANAETGERQTVPAAAVFIYIGAEPRTEWLADSVLRDEQGFILAGPDLKPRPEFARVWKLDRDPYLLETCVPGIFAAGDVRHGSTKRIAFGVGDGAMAVQFVHQYLAKT
jgi:thioredoxin reductase (NADPH)